MDRILSMYAIKIQWVGSGRAAAGSVPPDPAAPTAWRLLIYPFTPMPSSDRAQDLDGRPCSILSELGLDSIDVDDNAGSVELVEMLAGAGHRRIGYAAWRYPVGVHWTHRRLRLHGRYFFRAGLEFHSDWTINVHKHSPAHAPAIAHSSPNSRGAGVTAWVCAADHQAYHLVHDLPSRSQRAADCSVTGFDGIERRRALQDSRRCAWATRTSALRVGGLTADARSQAPRRKFVERRLVEGENRRAMSRT